MPLTFYYLGRLPQNFRNVKGALLVAKRMAQQLDPTIDQVLIKGFAHESTFRRNGEMVENPLHYTMQFKTPDLASQHKHYTAHADVKIDSQSGIPKNWFDTLLSPKTDSNNKLVIDLDLTWSERRQTMWNPWVVEANKLSRFTEDIEGWTIGPAFIASPSSETTGMEALPEKVILDVQADQKESMMTTEEEIKTKYG